MDPRIVTGAEVRNRMPPRGSRSAAAAATSSQPGAAGPSGSSQREEELGPNGLRPEWQMAFLQAMMSRGFMSEASAKDLLARISGLETGEPSSNSPI